MGFYCQKVCGDVNFSIKEWNKAFKYCNDAGIEGIERDGNIEFYVNGKQAIISTITKVI